ncbi:unnamed protein product [Effrenium voratum]|nr:unnamed protein product [Effrenium voratum]
MAPSPARFACSARSVRLRWLLLPLLHLAARGKLWLLPRSELRRAAAGGLLLPGAARAAGLNELLQRRTARDLTSPIFNIPPKQQVYPEWLEGNWTAASRFVGFEFPTLPRQQVMREEDVPGFKKCSIIDFADVGKSPLEYNMSFVRDGEGVVEDWPQNLCSTVLAHLEPKGRVTSVDYSPKQDPNRLTMRLVSTKNAERVELFVNSRDSEQPEEQTFLCSEYRRRQVTFSSRVAQGNNCNYQHFKTFQRLPTARGPW